MNPEKPILHTGVVESFQNGVARVKIYHGSNCGACPAKGGCASAGFGEEGQTVDVRYEGELRIGQRVDVALRARTDFMAIVLAFGVPIILLVGVMLLTIQSGLGQITSALVSIGSVVAYLGILALFRKKLQKKFELMIVV